jgi:hypothetical protein
MRKHNLPLNELNLLDFRKQIGDLFGKQKSQIPILIKKRGRAMGLFIPETEIDSYLDWLNTQKTLELYYSLKPELIALGDKFLQKKNLDLKNYELDEVVSLIFKK